MKEETLEKLRKELTEKKEKIKKHNEEVKRIKELRKDPKVKEYIKLTESLEGEEKQIKQKNNELINSIYRKYVYEIEEEESNKIFVYIGTYCRSCEIDIEHGSSDYRVDYDSESAEYRTYWDLESYSAINVNINECEEFENIHTIICPDNYFKIMEYHRIQEEFFYNAVLKNQEYAKKLVLKKYPKLSDKKKVND